MSFKQPTAEPIVIVNADGSKHSSSPLFVLVFENEQASPADMDEQSTSKAFSAIVSGSSAWLDGIDGHNDFGELFSIFLFEFVN